MTQAVVAARLGQPTPCLLPEIDPNSNDSDLLNAAGSVFVHDRSRGRARILAMSHGWQTLYLTQPPPVTQQLGKIGRLFGVPGAGCDNLDFSY